MNIRRWNLLPTDADAAAELAEACEISPFLALLLDSRGLHTPEEVYGFIAGQEEETDPFAFVDLDKAVDRITAALEKHEKILVYGDYDVDGITATVLLYTYLREQGADVICRVPYRENGYGLHKDGLQEAADEGATLLVTVDTGISLTTEETDFARSLGIDIVVTDHHQPSETLPDVVAVVDPHRADDESPCKDFAGVGMAFMLVCALEGDGDTVLARYGDLLTLGTVADVIPLRGFNRDLMRRGMQLLNESTRPGILALRRVAGVEDKLLTAASTSFSLVPRLNAAGRMGDPYVSLKLLLADSAEEADLLAAQVQEMNVQRQKIGAEIEAQANEQLAAHPEWLYDRVLVVSGNGWHGGVLGIIAARLMERYGKPTVVITVGEDGVAHGSGRSIEGFSLYDALAACSEYLSVFGGHELAAGLTLPQEDIEVFRRAINRHASEFYPRMPVPSLDVAVRLRPGQVNVEKLALLEVMEPFGAGNPAPLFGLFRMKLDNITAVGNGHHLRLSLSRDDVRLSAIKFQTTPEEFPIPCGSEVNCLVYLEKNEYRGTVSVSFRVKDIGFADTDREELLSDIARFEDMMRDEMLPQAEDALPTREELGYFYSFLRACGSWKGTPEQLHHALRRPGTDGEDMSLLRILTALELWREAGILQVTDHGELIEIKVLPVSGKADLTATALWKTLERGDSVG